MKAVLTRYEYVLVLVADRPQIDIFSQISRKNFVLNTGASLPVVGLGTWQSKKPQNVYCATEWALVRGYRHIDTAFGYGNEEEG